MDRFKMFPSGELFSREECDAEGVRHGLYETWYRNGQQAERTLYHHGMRQGESIHWYPNGDMFDRTDYVCDKPEHHLELLPDDHGTPAIERYSPPAGNN